MEACFVTSKPLSEKLFPLLGSRVSYSTRRRSFVSQFHQPKKVGNPFSVTCKCPISCFLTFVSQRYFRRRLLWVGPVVIRIKSQLLPKLVAPNLHFWCRIVSDFPKYATFGESNTHPLTFLRVWATINLMITNVKAEWGFSLSVSKYKPHTRKAKVFQHLI